MKKIIKKGVLLAFAIMLFTQAVLPVIAQPNLSGIDPDARGSITINRFAGSTAAAPTSGTPLNGIPYTIQLVRLRSDIDPATDDLRDPASFEVITGAGAFSETASTVNGIVSFDDLPQGIFLVTEGTHTVTPEGDRVAPFIVGIPRRVMQGEGENATEVWVYDVVVYPKSEADVELSFAKDVEMEWDADLDDLVATWELQTVVPRLIGNATHFEFVDPLDSRLTLVPNSVVGTYQRAVEVEDVMTTVAHTLDPVTHFTYSIGSDDELRIILTQAGMDHLAAYAITAPSPDGTLVFTFRTHVSMLEADLGDITNEALLLFNTTDEEEGIRAAGGPVTQFAMEIEKIDVNGTRLSEATFEVFLDEDRDYPAFPNASGVNRSFTTTNGVVFIPGLQAGTFYLYETASPEGFRPILDSLQVVINESHGDETREYVVLLQVVNEVEGGFYLPVTGGVGTILFTVVGLGLIGGAVTLAIIAKRRRRTHNSQDD